MKLGNFAVLNSTQGGFLPWAIRLVTGPWTHCSFGIGDVHGKPWVLEAEPIVVANAWENTTANPTVTYEVYSVNLPDGVLSPIAERLTAEYNTRGYGVLQLLWFIPIKVCGWFGVDIRAKRNPLSAGIICSEVTYKAKWAMGSYFPQLIDTLNEWDPNNYSPVDDRFVMCKHTEIFTLVERHTA